MRRTLTVIAIAALAAVTLAALAIVATAQPPATSPARVCFDRAQWDADPAGRPCVRVTVFEDGSADVHCLRGCVYAERRDH